MNGMIGNSVHDVADRGLLRRRLRCAAGAVHAQTEQLLAGRPSLGDLERQEVDERQQAGEQAGHPVVGQRVGDEEQHQADDADDDAVDEAGEEPQK